MVAGEAAQIIDALLARAAQMASSGPSLPVSFPEVGFTPPTSGKYLKVDFFANRPAWEGLSSGKLAQGLLQVTVIWPRGQGVVTPNQIAQQVIDYFSKGTILRSGSAKVTVSREPWAATPITEDAQLSVPVTIPWTATAV